MLIQLENNPNLERLAWGACMIFSVLYFVLFYQTATNTENPPFGHGMTDGFCVWDFPPPHDDETCDYWNSHRIAWWLDLTMTGIALVLWMIQVKTEGYNKTTMTLFVGIAAVILVHGLLHGWIASMGCFLPIHDSQVVRDWGEFFYAAFTFMLCMVLFVFGVPEMKQKTMWAGGIALVTLIITKNIVPEYSLSTLFAVSHPLSSFVGFISTSGYLTWPVGIVFLLATLAGIVELVACASFHLSVGGHVWYDLFLHIAMLVALLLAPSPENETKEPKPKDA